MKNATHIPSLAASLLKLLCKSEFIEEIIGDLHEYQDELREKPTWKRRVLFWFHVFNFLRPWALKRPFANQSSSVTMLSHYFKFAFRNLRRKRTASIINFTGLLTGLTAVILIGLWVHDELSFNTYHPDHQRVAKVLRSQTHLSERSIGENQPFALASELRANYSDYFESVAMEISWSTEHALAVGNNTFLENGRFVESGAIEILGLNIEFGNREALSRPNSILLSMSVVEKLFGSENPVGQIVELDSETELMVGGVYADLPKNSEFFGIHYLINFNQFYRKNTWADATSWRGSNALLYVKLQGGIDLEVANSAIERAMLPYVDEATRNERNPSLTLHPMQRWHLYSNLDEGSGTMSAELRFVWFYSGIGLFILLLVCVNFINLSTARFVTRSKEVGVRKTMGSKRTQLIAQFLVETLVIIALAYVASIFMSSILLPWFNGVTGKEMVMPLDLVAFWAIGLTFVGAMSFLAGIYPAILLSSFQPVKALKQNVLKVSSAVSVRKVLVVFQFTISIALIAGTLVIKQQINFANDRPEGYDKKDLVLVKLVTKDHERQYKLLSDELMKTGVIEKVSGSGSPVTENQYNNNGFTWKGKHPDFDPIFNDFYVSPDFGQTVKWQVLKGRDFSAVLNSDQSSVLINESAAALLGFDNPIGQLLTWESREGKAYKIIGVIQDMVRNSPFETTPPSLFFLSNELPYIHMRLSPNVASSEALASIDEVFEEVMPEEPVDYQFVEDLYKTKFEKERRMGRLSGFFTALAIIISGLGLYGLALFETVRRTKEIGVRKVLGASIVSLWNLMTKDLLSLILLSSVVAIPLAWYFLDDWLVRYEYRMSLEWWMFAAASFGALLIGLTTVSYQSLKLAFSNPVKSLRSE